MRVVAWVLASFAIASCLARRSAPHSDPAPSAPPAPLVNAVHAADSEPDVRRPPCAPHTHVDTQAPIRHTEPAGVLAIPKAACALPIVAFFHGSWDRPASCSYFERAAFSVPAAAVCPRGNYPAAGGFAWAGTIDQKLGSWRALRARLDDLGVQLADGGVLMGFSSGAIVAYEAALREPGRFRGLVLMSMSMAADAKALQAAGIRRVACAAGDRDGSRTSMSSLCRSLTDRGLEARFYSLGRVGHGYATDMPALMERVVAWVRE